MNDILVHLSFECVYEIENKIPLSDCDYRNTMDSPSFFFLHVYYAFSLLWSCFRVTLSWFISSTPATELDRIIIGLRNSLMNLRLALTAESDPIVGRRCIWF